MIPIPDLSLVQVTFLSFVDRMTTTGPVSAVDLREALRPVVQMGRGPMFYRIANRLVARGLAEKFEGVQAQTALPSVAYQLTKSGESALADFQNWAALVLARN